MVCLIWCYSRACLSELRLQLSGHSTIISFSDKIPWWTFFCHQKFYLFWTFSHSLSHHRCILFAHHVSSYEFKEHHLYLLLRGKYHNDMAFPQNVLFRDLSVQLSQWRIFHILHIQQVFLCVMFPDVNI